MQSNNHDGPLVTPPTRRDFFSWVGAGLGTAALAELLVREQPARADSVAGEVDDPPPHFPPKARRAIHVFLCGGLSHIDSFDYRPELARLHGQPLPGGEKPDVFFGQVGLLRKPDWEFRQRGQSGLWVSELFPHLAQVADELTVVRSMTAETSNHTPATFQANTGFRLNGFPVLGAWLSFGLGSETDELPAYVVIPDNRGVPAGGSINWSNGFLPARHQGVTIRSRGPAIHDLAPARHIVAGTEAASRRLLTTMNQRHLAEHGPSDALLARIRSYDMAARMQLAVPEVSDLDRETATTHELYGMDQPKTGDLAAVASWRGDYWNAGCVLCSSSREAPLDRRASIGTATRIWWPITARKPPASIARWPDYWPISSNGACWKILWLS